MRLRKKNREVGDVDISAFSDIAFLLIIFFVLTTTFVRHMGIGADIPDSTSDPEMKREHELPTISLTREGVFLNERAIDIEALRRELRQMKLPEKAEEERAVIVESAPDVEFERYFKVVSAISAAGGILALVEGDGEES